jgi:dTDP-4-dehydrorhamnose reductase
LISASRRVNPLELWGGVECTVNRVGDIWYDQLARSGHSTRVDDLDRIADLGIRTLRYPLLWESASKSGSEVDWTWADERLSRLRALNIRPIVGLVHHGSGPAHTNLIDEHFAEGLARYAGQVARRFPWVDSYTPVNEPLTTARFSGLYGIWYPHGRDDRTFVRALINQCRAVVLAMQAIRRINPAARLVQTDDVSKTYSTPKMAYQARFDNERRWIAWDLLCGKVGASHPLRNYLLSSGVLAQELEWFRDNPCPPEIIGINHYVTSDRFLDEEWSRYPSQFWGANGQERYADLDAVRVLPQPRDSWKQALREAWDRYRIPIAITEVHLGCTREEQLRWFRDAWCAAHACRASGVDIRAVTTWALFGSFNWDSLLTADRGHYEPGAFDVRASEPRPTAIATQVRELISGKQSWHPVLDSPGWWRRPQRLLYGLDKSGGPTGKARRLPRARLRRARPILICGNGMLGGVFAEVCSERGLAFRACSRAEIDICDPESIARAIEQLRPWAVINAAGYARVVEAEQEPARCHHENVMGATALAAGAAASNLPLIMFSSDLVFDGRSSLPYVESSPVSPTSVFGRSKVAAESAVLTADSRALCVRTSALFGSPPQTNYLTHALQTLKSGGRFAAPEDVIVSPTFVPDLVQASLDLLIDGQRGLWHVVNQGSVSWARLVQLAADSVNIDTRLLERRQAVDDVRACGRSRSTALSSERGVLLPTLEDAIARYAGSMQQHGG